MQELVIPAAGVLATNAFKVTGPIYGAQVLNAALGAQWRFDEGLWWPISSAHTRYPIPNEPWRVLEVTQDIYEETRILLATADDDTLGDGASPLRLNQVQIFQQMAVPLSWAQSGAISWRTASIFDVTRFSSIYAAAIDWVVSSGFQPASLSFNVEEWNPNPAAGNHKLYAVTPGTGLSSTNTFALISMGTGLGGGSNPNGAVAASGWRPRQVALSLTGTGSASGAGSGSVNVYLWGTP